jgi:hypothetical protein
MFRTVRNELQLFAIWPYVRQGESYMSRLNFWANRMFDFREYSHICLLEEAHPEPVLGNRHVVGDVDRIKQGE